MSSAENRTLFSDMQPGADPDRDEREAFLEGFASRLKKLMADRGMSAADVAERSGVTRSAILNYMQKRRVPDVFTVYRISRALGDDNVDLNWLIAGRKTEFVLIPLYMHFKLTGKDFTPAAVEDDWYSFRRKWLLSKVPPGVENKDEYVRRFFLYRAGDEDMAPLIRKGEIALIDPNPQTRLSVASNCPYLVWLFFDRDDYSRYTFRTVVVLEKTDEGLPSKLMLLKGDGSGKVVLKTGGKREVLLKCLVGRVLWVGTEKLCSENGVATVDLTEVEVE